MSPERAARVGDRVLLVLLVPLAALTWWFVSSLPALLERMFAVLEGLGRVGGGVTGPEPGLLALPLLGWPPTFVSGALLGGVLAGLLARPADPARRRAAAGATVGGVLAGLVVVLAQAFAELDEAATSPFTPWSGTAMAVTLVLVSLLGWGAGTGALGGRTGTGIALGVVAGTLPAWLAGSAFAVLGPGSLGPGFDLGWTTWIGVAVLVGALVTVGLRPVSRLARWLLVVGVAWTALPLAWSLQVLVPTVVNSTGTGPMGGRLPSPWQVLQDALLDGPGRPLPLVAALVVAAGIAAVRARAAAPPGR
ncbi:hypothetical protein GCU60_11030 [Blastococcus saxobsidens]|uniref:Uncharacterized protein n=1 Tax=Blastococcus saxobsidens TaxID=138336 RepID=A0A6L9W2K5_9ACTN|nr:hypothetical protein [Blastococcus saxobsidens]NEK86287.1 hypothetical protein [Blastococcus saxobsidens]